MKRSLPLLLLLSVSTGCLGIFGGKDDGPGNDPNGPRIVSFGPDRNTIGPRESVTLTWLTSNALGLALTDQHGQTVDVSGLDVTSGSVSVSPTQTTQYTLTASGEAGSDPARSTTTVTVEGEPAATSCFRSLEVTCTRSHECTEDKTTDADADGTADFYELWGQNPTDCQARFDAGFTWDQGGTTITIDGVDCANMTAATACDDTAAPNYDDAAANLCTDAYQAMSCAEYNGGTANPAACNQICT